MDAVNDNSGLKIRISELRARYGELLTLEDLTEALRYPTVVAARRAYNRGKFPIPLYRIPNRCGYFGKVDELALFIENMQMSQPVLTSPK